MGLDIYLEFGKDGGNIQQNSKRYPTHYFKVGYFRSSYNEWGLNRVLQKTIGKDLYHIFEPPNKKHDFKPNWEDCRMRCLNIIEEFNDFVTNKLGNIAVTTISGRLFTTDGIPKSEKEATDIFLRVRDEKESNPNFSSFINRDGHFYLNGLKCYAFISGKDSFDRDCVYVIYEPELKENEKNDIEPNVYKDYKRCLEIVLETIEYVLDHPKKEMKKFNLHWSA